MNILGFVHFYSYFSVGSFKFIHFIKLDLMFASLHNILKNWPKILNLKSHKKLKSLNDKMSENKEILTFELQRICWKKFSRFNVRFCFLVLVFCWQVKICHKEMGLTDWHFLKKNLRSFSCKVRLYIFFLWIFQFNFTSLV